MTSTLNIAQLKKTQPVHPRTPFPVDSTSTLPALVDSTATVLNGSATSFPQTGTIADGTQVDLLVDGALGVMWRFRYVAAVAATPWLFVGGPPMYAAVATSETRANTAFGDLTTVGPSLVVPRTGTYLIGLYARLSNNTASDGAVMAPTSTTLGAAAATNGVSVTSGNVGDTFRVAATTPPLALGAGETLKAQYATITGGTGTFLDRRIWLTPVAVI